MPSAEFIQKMRDCGINSRITFNKLIVGSRQISESRISDICRSLDLTFVDGLVAKELIKNPKTQPQTRGYYQLGVSSEILSNPLHTIIMNLCNLKHKKMNHQNICETLSNLYLKSEVYESINLLLANEMIYEDQEQYLRKKDNPYKLNSPQGIKVDFARKYISKSLAIAEKGYDLPLDEREYTAFTAAIKREDMLKVKDLVRNFRKAIYELSDSNHYDCVVHTNLNVMLIASDVKLDAK